MKHIALPLLALTLLASACVEHEEIEFEGTVVGIRNCTSAFFDANAGYIIQLTKPEGYGGEIVSTEGERMNHLVVLYEPDKHIVVRDKVKGTCYWDDTYSRANCTLRWDTELPEGVIIKVHVEN